jgi:two-component system, sensor histidine kinase and response regulator
LRTRLKNLAWQLAGSYEDFSLENRMFNIISMIALIAIAVSLPINYLLGYPWQVLLFTACIMALQIYLYYISRFKKRFYISRIIFAVLSYVFLSVNYFFNSGINGPTILAFFLSYIFLIAIYNRSSYWLWTTDGRLLLPALDSQ